MAKLEILLAALAAAAQAPTLPGLWEGTIGTIPVRACFAKREFGDFGAYYYRSQLKLIPLDPVDNAPGTFGESSGEGSPRWRIEKAGADSLAGRWSHGKRVLPIRLKRVAAQLGEDSPCAAAAFHAPRLAGLKTTASSASRDFIAYERLVLDTRGRFDASVDTFRFGGRGEAVDRINAALLQPLSGDPPEWFACVREALERSPYEGSFHVRLEPALISRRWLSVVVEQDVFCGGAHPSGGRAYRAFDLTTGREVDILDWFNAKAVRRERIGESSEVFKTLTPAFRSFLLAGTKPDAECGEIVRSEEYWNVGLTRKGLVFAPSLAHAVRACGEEVTRSFSALKPWLTAEGARNLTEIAAEKVGQP